MKITGPGYRLEIDQDLLDKIEHFRRVLESFNSLVQMHMNFFEDLAVTLEDLENNIHSQENEGEEN